MGLSCWVAFPSRAVQRRKEHCLFAVACQVLCGTADETEVVYKIQYRRVEGLPDAILLIRCSRGNDFSHLLK